MVNIEIWAFPLSAMLSLAFCVGLYLSYDAFRRLKCRRMLMVVTTSTVAFLTAVEGTFKLNLQHGAPFLAAVAVLTVLVGMEALEGVKCRRPLSYVLTHAGLFLILFAGFFGAPDFETVSMVVYKDAAAESSPDASFSTATKSGHDASIETGRPDVSFATAPDGRTVPLPFSVSLEDFRIDTYDDGISPKQYTSTLTIDGQQKTTAVNRPCRHKGWLIYQADYDRAGGSYSVLRLVRDHWLPLVFLGMAVLALGAVLELRRTWHSKAVIPVVMVLALIFGGISLAKINFGTLAPALRSLWFVPHLIIYMVAYSVLALSLLAAVFGKVGSSGTREGHPAATAELREGQYLRQGQPAGHPVQNGLSRFEVNQDLAADDGTRAQRFEVNQALAADAGTRAQRFEVNQALAAKLLGTASALLILGMLCGAVWAKIAWGDYWTWDAKECWAAVTWLLTLAGTHLKFPLKKLRFALVILLAFLAMQVTWYGVNYLPSAENSMHTYTK